jgi:hypothetical protein
LVSSRSNFLNIPNIFLVEVWSNMPGLTYQV